MERDDAILDYLQGRLAPEERLAFEQTMAQDAALAAEVDVMRAVRTELASGPKHEQADAVWDRLSVAMDGSAQPANENRRPALALLKYAAVAVIAIGTWHTTVVPRVTPTQDGFRAASEESGDVILQVKFASSATLAEVGAVLRPLGGTISDGPTALGVVRVSFADMDARDAARVALGERSDLVELVLDQ